MQTQSKCRRRRAGSYIRRLSTVLAIFIAAWLTAACATEPPAARPSQTRDTNAAPAAPAAEQPAAAMPTPTQTLASATSLPPDEINLTLEPVAAGLDRPLFITHAGDGSGRIFVVEKPGRIKILRSGEVLSAPFLDISDRVGSSGSEQGLLGLAFPPNYSETGYFYLNYTDGVGNTAISRFRVSPDNPDSADPTTESPVLYLEQPARNHNGGMLAFGPDGYLYIGTGDGGAANDRFGNGQNSDTLLGKMLRIDVTTDDSQPYTIPSDNPWVTADWNGADVRDEIWALGLRNPWRYSFDRKTGNLWIADVGQNAYEEINFTPAGHAGGLNYGWPIMEGTHCFPDSAECDRAGLVMPVVDYSHAGHCSVTGGYVYRGAANGHLDGLYFYGDYCSGTIWALWPGENGAWEAAEALQSGLTLSSFGEDEAGEIYLSDLNDGTVYRLSTHER